MTRRTFLLGLQLAGLGLLSGCVTVTAPDFAASGRFSVTISDTVRGRDSVSGKFAFSRRGSTSRLDLLTPLNGILARIEVTPEEATLSTHASDEPLRAPDVDTLLMQTLGFTVPVGIIEEWALADGTPEGYDWDVRILKREKGFTKTLRAKRHFTSTGVSLTLVFDSVSP